jgi:actin-related protein
MTTPLNTENYIVATHLWYERTGPKITKVHWTWEMLNGVNIDATRLMQQDVMLQFAYGVNTQKNYHVTPAQTACVVDVDTSGLTSMLLSCNDLFGNWMPTNYSLR